MRKNPKRKRRKGSGFAAFALSLLILTGMVFLRARKSGQEAPPEAAQNAPVQTALHVQTTPPPATAVAVKTPPPGQKPLAAESRQEQPALQHGYTAETYQLVSDMIYIRRHEVEDGEAQIPDLLAQLREADPKLGETWTQIMDYWSYANTAMPINRDGLPDDLPEDDSLCLVVLGFQLLPDGEMAPELLGRCQVALSCARKYPNALIAVTGGGTAAKDHRITEAGVMADWLIEQGIAPERIIREDASMTTGQNATNTCAILTKQVPQVHALAIISSDYHLPLGCLLFTEAALLYGYEHGTVPYEVVSNAAWATDGKTPGYSGMKNQASYVWVMANPRY